MVSEKVVGSVFVIFSVIVAIIYIVWGILPFIFGKPEMFSATYMEIAGAKIYVPPLYWLLFIPIFFAIFLLCFILGWIGLTLIRLPAPEKIDIEKLEKELEEELKEEEKKEEKKES